MRFEDSALENDRVNTIDFDNLRGSGEAAHDSYRSLRHGGELRQKPNDLFIRLAIHGRGGHVQFPYFAEPPREFSFARPGANLKGDAGLHAFAFFAIEYWPEDP